MVFRRFALAATMLAVLGAGCASSPLAKQIPSGPKTANVEGLTPEQAAEKINFVPGSVVEIRQTFLGFGAKLAAKLAGDKKEGTRIVVIERFAPGQTANVSWKLTNKTETDASKAARAAAQKAGKPVPEPVLADTTALGSVDALELKASSKLYLPAFWPEKDHASSFGTSGIWLSSDAFAGLDRNRVSTVDFGILNPELQGAISKVSEFADAFRQLASQQTKIENRTDVNRLDGDKDPIEFSITVNGKDVKVAAYRAHTWFGEIVVLKNKQNPLILKATLNPAATGAANILSSNALIQALAGYEVTEIKDAQE